MGLPSVGLSANYVGLGMNLLFRSHILPISQKNSLTRR